MLYFYVMEISEVVKMGMVQEKEEKEQLTVTVKVC
jgi:hypothetical protein